MRHDWVGGQERSSILSCHDVRTIVAVPAIEIANDGAWYTCCLVQHPRHSREKWERACSSAQLGPFMFCLERHSSCRRA